MCHKIPSPGPHATSRDPLPRPSPTLCAAALMLAAHEGNEAICKVLLDAGASALPGPLPPGALPAGITGPLPLH
jgi:hypothetical protein